MTRTDAVPVSTPRNAQPVTLTLLPVGTASSTEPNTPPTATGVDHGSAVAPFCVLFNVNVYAPATTGVPLSFVMSHVVSMVPPLPVIVRTVVPFASCTRVANRRLREARDVTCTLPLAATVRPVIVDAGATRPAPMSCSTSCRNAGSAA